MHIRVPLYIFLLVSSIAYAVKDRNLYNKDNVSYDYKYSCGCGTTSGTFGSNNSRTFQDTCDQINRCTLQLDNGSQISLEPSDRSNIVIQNGKLSLSPNP